MLKSRFLIPNRGHAIWLLLLAAWPLVAASAADTLHTSPRPATVTGSTDAGLPAQWRVVGCVRREVETGNPTPDMKMYSYLNHAPAECDMQEAGEHKTKIRINVTQGLTEAGESLGLYYDLRVYDNGNFHSGFTGTEQYGTYMTLYNFDRDAEIDWSDAPGLSTGITSTVTFEVGTWQGGVDQWARKGHVVM